MKEILTSAAIPPSSTCDVEAYHEIESVAVCRLLFIADEK